MRQIDSRRDVEPIRLFRSNLLESFTHIHPALVLIVWLPVAVFFLLRAVVNLPTGANPITIPLGLLMGLFTWSFIEYAAHRFVFHFRPRTPRQERILFILHGVHHAQPQVKTRLVLPPTLTLPLAVPFYGLFYLVLGMALGAGHWVAPAFAGFVTGYVAYDMLHYATHHYPMRRGVLKYLKRYHLQHHYKTPQQRFGVTSPLWDMLFGTKPA
jgi:sterol desaturase/sphingolipid hydroxylase (fatty acid hydroxylase superfamily)